MSGQHRKILLEPNGRKRTTRLVRKNEKNARELNPIKKAIMDARYQKGGDMVANRR